jgi:hypothetical protein
MTGTITTCELKLKKMDLSLSCLRIIRPRSAGADAGIFEKIRSAQPGYSKKAGTTIFRF